MLANVLTNGLSALQSIVLSLIGVGITYGVTLIRQHLKNRFVADSLALVTTVAGTVVGSVVQTTAKDGMLFAAYRTAANPGSSPPAFGALLTADLKAKIVTDIKNLGASALAQLQTHAGLDSASIDALVDHLVAQTVASLAAPSGPVVATVAAVAAAAPPRIGT